MVVVNRHRTTAIVIRHDGARVTLVPMKSGRLSAHTLGLEQFSSDWHEMDYALPRALDTFLAHARTRGASQEALKGLERLEERGRRAIASLF